MPSLAETLTQPLRSQYAAQLDKNENRISEYGAFNLFKTQADDPMSILDAQTKANIEKSFGNTVQIPVIDYDNPTIGNVRTCDVQVGGSTSHLVTLNMATMVFGFPMIPSQHYNNDVAYQALYNRQLMSRLYAAAKMLDQLGVNFLNLNKNQYFPADMTKYYAQVGGAFQVPRADQVDFYNILKSVLATQDFPSDPDVLSDPMGMAGVRKMLSNGANNADNTAYQLSGIGDFFESNRITSGAGVRSTQYMVADNNLAFVQRLDPDCLQGRTIGGEDSPVKQWSKVAVPILGEIGSYFRADCADESAVLAAQRLTGLTRAYVESFEWSFDFCFFGAYNSDPVNRYGPITKFELLQN